MNRLKSKDGTTIAFDQQGDGPALILVDGALSTRSSGSKPELAKLLAQHYMEAGGSAFVYGHSSGGCLALDATVELGQKVKKLAMYEAPYNDDPEAQEAWGEYIKNLTEALASDRRGDAVALFMAYIGMPAAQIEGMRQAPFWGGMEALAPTLAYDHAAIMGKDGSIPTERPARVQVPTLVMSGANGAPFMLETAKTLSKAIPVAKLSTLDGQTHDVHPEALAPILVEFFAA